MASRRAALVATREALRGRLSPREACAFALATVTLNPDAIYPARLVLEENGVRCYMTQTKTGPHFLDVTWRAEVSRIGHVQSPFAPGEEFIHGAEGESASDALREALAMVFEDDEVAHG